VLGTNIGNYAVTAAIGEGGMGSVYLAEHAILGRRAAVKVLRPELSTHSDIVARFFNEARALTAIRHPSIVEVLDFGYMPDGSAYLVMEYLDGESLGARCRRLHKLDPRHALMLVRQIAGALAAAHERGVVHRDLKPENIFLVSDPEVAGGERIKVLDFGIAKLAEPGNHARTQTGSMLGTPTYMSPEQCRGAGSVDARADLYALGCLLFELLTATTPFSGSGFEVLLAHLGRPAPKPSERVADLPEVVDDLVGKLMAKRPADRAQTADAVVEMIDEALDVLDAPRSQIAKLAPPSRPRRATAKTANDRPAVRAGYTTSDLEPVADLPARPHRARWAALGAVLALAVAGGGFAAFRYIAGSDATAASSPQIDQSTNNHAAEVPKVFRDEGDVRLKVWWRDDAVTTARPLRMALDLRNKLNRPLGAESIVVIVEDPTGKSMGITARPRQAVPEQYSATVRFSAPGRYTVKVFAPETPSSFDFPIDVK